MLSLPSARTSSTAVPKVKGMLCVWSPWTHSQGLSVGKRERGVPSGPGTPRAQVSPPSVSNVVVAAVQPSAAVLKGRLGHIKVDILLDSGSTVSLVRNSILPRTLGVKLLKPGDLQLVSAAGEPMPVVGQANVVVQVGQLSVEHPLVVVDSLISPVILGMDFLQQHGLVLDFASSPISVTTRHTPPKSHGQLQDIQPIVEVVQKAKAKICAVYSESSSKLTEEVVDDCAIPRFSTTTGPDYDMPQCSTDSLSLLLNEYQELFRTSPGCTTAAEHFIPTSGTPVKVPPRRVPANYRVEVERQSEEMLAEGIIEKSSNAWLAPAVFVR